MPKPEESPTLPRSKFSPTIINMSPLGALRAAADGLAHHPHDHGWRNLYALFLYGLKNSATHLTNVLLEAYKARPVSATHLLTLLGISLKLEAAEQFPYIASDAPLNLRLSVLEEIIQQRSTAISPVLLSRQNSFTCARRFLVSRVILSAYFSRYTEKIRFADLGTGLGILPRQLNSRSQYELFADDLMWPEGIPEFKHLPIESAHGVDRGPMPDVEWVRACYGLSEYYTALYNELETSLHDPQVRDAQVLYHELDLLDEVALVSFIRHHHINAINLSYVLYELEDIKRRQVIDILTRELPRPGIIIITEPRDELHREGCVVEVFVKDNQEPSTLCFVSDGHFMGYVIPLDDYQEFMSKAPIEYKHSV
jgi:hypothetical protein